MILNGLYQKVLTNLKPLDSRAAYYIAKELAMIDLNLCFFDGKKDADCVTRLISLSQHVRDTFNHCTLAMEIADDIVYASRVIRSGVI